MSIKQHITKEQWNELSEEQQLKFIKSFNSEFNMAELIVQLASNWGGHFNASIGQMIEFLGEDLNSIHGIDNLDTKWTVSMVIGKGGDYDAKELADALWSAVKDKLCQE